MPLDGGGTHTRLPPQPQGEPVSRAWQAEQALARPTLLAQVSLLSGFLISPAPGTACSLAQPPQARPELEQVS